jgi:nucleotide-binding universal stress UspA family protein
MIHAPVRVHDAGHATGPGIYRDIVVGVDGSAEADTTPRLAARLSADGARMVGLSVPARAVDRRPADAILTTARRCRADLIAIGARRATRIARDSHCSVLVGRAGVDPDVFPERIVVGVGDSVPARRALS